MLDLHCHILPGLDDGAGDLEEALAMVRRAAEQGVCGIVATPHYLDGKPAAHEVREGCGLLRQAVQTAGLQVEIYEGMEVYLCPGLEELVQRGEALTINGRGCLLLELPFSEVPAYCEETLFELLLDGVSPLLAHPERHGLLSLETVAYWVERGLLIQINAGSLTGYFGRQVRRRAEQLLAGNLVHVVAGDAHSAGRRGLELARARERVTALAGEEAAEVLFVTNPQAIVLGGEVRRGELKRRRRFWLR